LRAAISSVISDLQRHSFTPPPRNRAMIEPLNGRIYLSDYDYFDRENSSIPSGDIYEGDTLNLSLRTITADVGISWVRADYPNSQSNNYDLDQAEQDVVFSPVLQDDGPIVIELNVLDGWAPEDTISLTAYNRSPEVHAVYDHGDYNGNADLKMILSGSTDSIA